MKQKGNVHIIVCIVHARQIQGPKRRPMPLLRIQMRIEAILVCKTFKLQKFHLGCMYCYAN